MTVGIISELQEEEGVLSSTQERVDRLRRELADYKMRLCKSMVVGEIIPCKVVKLSDGQYAVHVWVESSSKLHIVELTELEDV